jgi:hypothetical protein
VWSALAPLAAVWTVSLGVHQLAGRNRRWAWIAYWLSLFPVLAVPFLIPPEQRFLRLVAAISTAAGMSKLYDLLLPATPHPSLKDFVIYGLNPTNMVLRRLSSEPIPSRKENLRRIFRGATQLAIGGGALWGTLQLDLQPALAHLLKLPLFFFALLGGLEILVAMLRLTLGRARDVMGPIFSAASPAEFWRRYNRAVGQFLYENLFKPAGGLRRPIRATLLIFVASSVLHEYVFFVPIGHIDGYQTAFFMIQGLGVALTVRWRPKGRSRVLGIAATVAFNLLTSFLFFASLKQVWLWW